MTVNIIFSSVASGNSMTDTQDSGTITPGGPSNTDVTEEQDIYIRHDADYAPITNCAWYIQRCVSTGYDGEDADADLTEIRGWGDTAGFGFQISQDANTAPTPFISWTSFSNTVGTPSSQIELPTSAIIQGTPADDGEIPVGGEAHVQVKWKAPASLGQGKSAGVRGLSLVFAYSATS